MSSACNAWGPNGARCEIRKHHVGEHAGMSTEGEWLQWRGVAQLRPTQTSAGLPQTAVRNLRGLDEQKNQSELF